MTWPPSSWPCSSKEKRRGNIEQRALENTILQRVHGWQRPVPSTEKHSEWHKQQWKLCTYTTPTSEYFDRIDCQVNGQAEPILIVSERCSNVALSWTGLGTQTDYVNDSLTEWLTGWLTDWMIQKSSETQLLIFQHLSGRLTTTTKNSIVFNSPYVPPFQPALFSPQHVSCKWGVHVLWPSWHPGKQTLVLRAPPTPTERQDEGNGHRQLSIQKIN